MKLGAGYNPALYAGSLELPKNVELLEFGLAEYNYVVATFEKKINLSLHVARSPITEEKQTQVKYLEKLKEKINNHSLYSIGFHLSGERNSGIGRYGFSSHYTDSSTKRENAIRFIKASQDLFQIPVWIENANFYSDSFNEVLKNFSAITDIVYKTDAKLIIDLTHLYIDVRNVGGNIFEIIDAIPWSDVAEIHLSGMIVGKDGVLHDGHSKPISEKIFSLFSAINENYLDYSNLFVTAEHTDRDWMNHQEQYYQDFHKITGMLNRKRDRLEPKKNATEDQYARRYLHKIIETRYPALKNHMDEYSFHQIIEQWMDSIIYNTNNYIVLNDEEMLDNDEKAILLHKDFKRYITEKCE